MLTSRRSATGIGANRATDVGVDAVLVTSSVAHSPQNLTVGGFEAPQDGHVAANRAAHSPQNLRPGSFTAPQLAQITRVSPQTSWGGAYRSGLGSDRSFAPGRLMAGDRDRMSPGRVSVSANTLLMAPRTAPGTQRHRSYDPLGWYLGVA